MFPFPVTYAPSTAHLAIMFFLQKSKQKLIEIVAKPGGFPFLLMFPSILDVSMPEVCLKSAGRPWYLKVMGSKMSLNIL